MSRDWGVTRYSIYRNRPIIPKKWFCYNILSIENRFTETENTKKELVWFWYYKYKKRNADLL